MKKNSRLGILGINQELEGAYKSIFPREMEAQEFYLTKV
jgi:hypothetical protein